MSVSLGASTLRRMLEQLVCGELSPAKRAELFEQLRANDDARALYDDVMEAFRVLEERSVAHAEIDLVQDWVLDSLTPVQDEAPAHVGWRGWLAVVLAVAAAVLLVVGPLRPTGTSDTMGIKGPAGYGGLGIQALCGTQGAALQSMQDGGCPVSGTLSFAYLVEPTAPAGVLTLFGVDEAGDVMYYAPTPVDAGAMRVSAGGWRPLSLSIDLDVNHEPGRVRLFALLSPRSPSVQEVDAMAAALQERPVAGPGAPPWHDRLVPLGVMQSVCPIVSTCRSAELEFSVYEEAP